MADAEDIARIALTFPEVTTNGSAFEVKGKGFCWFYQEKIAGQKGRVERRDVLAVRVANEDEKHLLLAADPKKFFTTDHYNGYPAILVRLPEIETDELTELLTDAWRTKAPRTLLAEFDAKTTLTP